MVAPISGRARIDDEKPTDTPHDMLMGMAIQHEIRVGFGETVELRAMWVDLGSERLPWRRMHHQNFFATDIEFDT